MSEKTKKDKRAGIDYLSNNSITAFKSCPYKFHLSYIENIEPIKENISLYFGKCYHSALDFHYKHNDLEQTLEYFESIFDAGLMETKIAWKVETTRKDGGDFRNEETSMHYGRKCLTNYINRYGEDCLNVLESEVRFEIEVAGFPYIGIIDKIVEINNRLYVLDYKTSSQKPDIDFLSHEHQISGYILGAKKLGYEIDGAIYDYLFKHKKPLLSRYYANRTDKQLEAFKEDVAETLKAIKSGTKFQNISSECRRCQFRSFCFLGKKLGDGYKKADRSYD